MTAAPPPPPPKSLWQKMSLRRLRWVLLVAVLAVTAGFGGLRDADHVTPVAFGETFNDGALRITPFAVEVASSMPDMPKLPKLSPECRYLVLDVKVENTAESAVPLPTQGVVVGNAKDCEDLDSDHVNDPLVIAGIESRFAAAVRLRDDVTVPLVEPGFTENMRMAWVVRADDLAREPAVTLRMPAMSNGYSTFRIARQWSADGNRYGEVTVSDLGAS